MIGMYSLGLVAERSGDRFTASSKSDRTFRPHRFLTLVEARGLVTVTDIEIAHEPQLVMPTDAYDCSFAIIDLLNKQFLKEHGLEGKSDAEIQNWLDARDMGMPGDGIGRFALPTLREGDEVVVRGRLDVPESSLPGLSLTGYAESPS